MTWGRYLVLALGVLAAVGATVGTGSFGGVSADRSVSVSVVEFDPNPHGLDEDGYLGIEVLGKDEREDTDTVNILYLVNQFPQPLTEVSVTVAEGTDTTVTPHARQDFVPMGPGENTVVRGTCHEPTGGWVTLPLEITASGSGVRVTKHLEIEVECKRVTPTPSDDTDREDDPSDEDDEADDEDDEADNEDDEAEDGGDEADGEDEADDGNEKGEDDTD